MKLNLPEYTFRVKTENNDRFIFDEIRCKFLRLTPEEWVRQNFIRYLIDLKAFPKSLFAIETGFKINTRQKRTDILVYSREAKPILLVECKAPDVKINQTTFEQAVTYNMNYKLKYMVLTNGLSHFAFKEIDGSWQVLKQIPMYEELL